MEARYSSDHAAAVSNHDDLSSAMPEFRNEGERRDWLLKTLGEQFCRKLGIFRVPSSLVLSVVIPVYNEKATIHEILRRVRAVPINKQIIIVDDCSQDGTREILKEIEKQNGDVTVIYHVINQGKGAALRTGFREATGDALRHRAGCRPRI